LDQFSQSFVNTNVVTQELKLIDNVTWNLYNVVGK